MQVENKSACIIGFQILHRFELLSVGKTKKNGLWNSLILIEDFTFRRTLGLSLIPCSRGFRIGVGIRGTLSERIDERS
ncbi:hypothetical protein P8452_52064 [Trifolium repens]|nr:hypothetical protein P8452_52064 [Trifolium repens]